jgi:hypothetical protein
MTSKKKRKPEETKAKAVKQAANKARKPAETKRRR